VSIPKYDELYKEILQAVADGKAQSIAVIRNFVAKQRNVSSMEQSIPLDSGRGTIFNNRVSWARAYLKAAGLISFPKRGQTQITEEGKKLLKNLPKVLDNEFLMRYDSFKDFLKRSAKKSPGTVTNADIHPIKQQEATPEEMIDSAFSQIKASLGDELLDEIMKQSPQFFERVVVQLLLKMGYGDSFEESGFVTQASKDEGIDGVIREDKLGFGNIYIQAKRYTDKTIGRPEVQAFVGAIANKAGKGLFITTAKFTEGAVKTAKENHIVLIDGEKLTSLMIEHDVGVSVVQTYQIKKIDSDFFSD